MEHTVIVAPQARGRDVGRALMAAVEDHARAGAHTILAGVSAGTAAGVAFHAAVGSVGGARLRAVGRSFGRWMDRVLMQTFPA
jgi:phosphinothricin acetyltransferase